MQCVSKAVCHRQGSRAERGAKAGRAFPTALLGMRRYEPDKRTVDLVMQDIVGKGKLHKYPLYIGEKAQTGNLNC